MLTNCNNNNKLTTVCSWTWTGTYTQD